MHLSLERVEELGSSLELSSGREELDLDLEELPVTLRNQVGLIRIEQCLQTP